MGVAVLINNGYYYLSGDEIGALMLYYLAQHRKGVVITPSLLPQLLGLFVKNIRLN